MALSKMRRASSSSSASPLLCRDDPHGELAVADLIAEGTRGRAPLWGSIAEGGGGHDASPRCTATLTTCSRAASRPPPVPVPGAATGSTRSTSATTTSSPSLRRALRAWHRLRRYDPAVLRSLPSPLLHPARIPSCAVVGNSGVLLVSAHGVLIDSHAAVFRLNNARILCVAVAKDLAAPVDLEGWPPDENLGRRILQFTTDCLIRQRRRPAAGPQKRPTSSSPPCSARKRRRRTASEARVDAVAVLM